MIEGLEVFFQPPVFALEQPPNLCQLLVRNTITDDEPRSNNLCDKHRCNVCKHINTATKVYINHNTVMPGNYNRDYANIVYLIHCKKCP